jgi:hypothetical protein
MKKINFGRLILAGLVAGLAFIFVEIIVEGSMYFVFRISEAKIFQEAFEMRCSGVLFHILNLGILFAICILIMWVYAVLRPRFSSRGTTAIVASLIFWLFAFLFVANHVNLGIIPPMSFISLAFNLIELPVAVIVGSNIYREG